MTDLVWSIKNGDLGAVKEKIENEKIDIKNLIEGRTLLHYAAGNDLSRKTTNRHIILIHVSPLLFQITVRTKSCRIWSHKDVT